MSDPGMMPAGVHPEVALLPWYVNGTLEDTERNQVARHLESCPDCRRELDDLSSLKRDLAAYYQSQSAPSPRLAHTVMARVAAECRATATRQPENGPWLNHIDEWFRSLFLPRWVPTLVALLLVFQAGILLWLKAPAPDTGEVSTRSLAMQTARIQLSFQSATTAGQIGSLLQSLSAKIIDGPTENGEYTIEVLAADEAAASKKLEVLRSRSDVVRSAQLLTP